MAQLLNFGVLGCGAISQFAHLPAFARAKRVRLEALCDSTEDLLTSVGAKAGVSKLYRSYDDLLADVSVHAVLIAAPDPFHKSAALLALDAGKHVLVEKPLATSVEECDVISKKVAATGLKLQVGSMKRHDPGVRFARDFIAERAGPLLSVAGIYRDTIHRHAMQEACLDRLTIGKKTNSSHVSDYKSNKERYNLWTQGVHLFDLLRFLAGDVAAVQAKVARRDGNCAWHGILEFASGGLGHFELVCKSCGDWWEQYTVYGHTGSVDVRVDFPFYHRPALARAFDNRNQLWETPLGAYSNAYVNQLDAFAVSVFDDRPTNPDVRDGTAAVMILDAVERSLALGTRVEVSPTIQ